MGFLSKLLGGKPPKQKPTALEIAQAEQAGKRDQRFQEAFMPLEMAAIDQYFDPSAKKFQESILKAQVNAQTAQAEAQSLRAGVQAAGQSGGTLSSGSNSTALTDTSLAAAEAQGLGMVEASAMAQGIRDEDGISLVRTGNDVSRSTSNSLGQLARQSNFGASSRLQAKMQVNQARSQALGQILSSTLAAGAQFYNDSKDGSMLDSDLRGPAKLMRGFQGQTTDPNHSQRLAGPPTAEGFYSRTSLRL